MNVTLRQVRSFLAVARCGSFTRAAQMLHLSQPALTIHIKQLETELGLRLFDRSTHHVRLTAAGTSFMPIIQSAISGFENALTSAARLSSRQEEFIRLACFPSFAAAVLPLAIIAFRSQHPGVSFQIRDVSARAGLAMVRSEEVDCAICHHDNSATDLHCHPLLQEGMYVVYPRNHPIDTLERLTLEAVVDEPLVLLNGDSDSRARIDAAIAGAGYLVFPAAEAEYMSTALGLVEGGLGVTILPRMAINLKAHPQLRARAIDDTPLIRPIGIATKRNYFVSPATRAFIDVLTSISADYMKDNGPAAIVSAPVEDGDVL